MDGYSTVVLCVGLDWIELSMGMENGYGNLALTITVNVIETCFWDLNCYVTESETCISRIILSWSSIIDSCIRPSSLDIYDWRWQSLPKNNKSWRKYNWIFKFGKKRDTITCTSPLSPLQASLTQTAHLWDICHKYLSSIFVFDIVKFLLVLKFDHLLFAWQHISEIFVVNICLQYFYSLYFCLFVFDHLLFAWRSEIFFCRIWLVPNFFDVWLLNFD